MKECASALGSETPALRLDAHAYAVVRVKVTGAEAISADPATVSDAIAAAVSASPGQWLRGLTGNLPLPGGVQLRVEAVEFAEDIESVLVDEIRPESEVVGPIEHLFDHTGESMNDYPGCRTAREGRLKQELSDVRATNDDLVLALARCRDLFPVPAPGGPLEQEWLAAMADPLAVPELLTAAAKAGLPLSAEGDGHISSNTQVERIRQ